VSGRSLLAAGLLGLASIGSPAPAGSQVQVSSEERFFRIEWQLERAGGRDAAIVGSLTNHYLYPLEAVRLQAQVVDEAGQVIHETLVPMEDVPPGGRGSFRLELPAAGARYVVTVHAFEFGRRESP
jgi:hypothetical protein